MAISQDVAGLEGRSVLRTAPGPRGSWLLGSIRALQTEPLRHFMEGRAAHGDVVAFRLGLFQAFLLAHPDHIHHVLQANHRNYDKQIITFRRLRSILGNGLVTADGADWQHQRAVAKPAFLNRRVAAAAPIVVRGADDVATAWHAAALSGAPVDVHVDMMRVTLRVAGAALFGADVDEDADAVGDALNRALREVQRRVNAIIALPEFVPTPTQLRLREARGVLYRLVDRLIVARREAAVPHDDLLTLLLEASDAESGGAKAERQLRDEVLTFLLAGHETTASTLSFTWYLLARHPEVGARLRAEVEAVLGGRAPTFDDLRQLTFTKMVIEEVMRLYPPVWAMERGVVADDAIGGYRIPAKSFVMLSPYVTHRHPAFWSEPERFDPERFRPEVAHERPRHAYFPFGLGPRVCIGATFAMAEAVLMLARLAAQFELGLPPGYEIDLDPNITLRPRRGLPMTVRAIGRA